MRLDRYIPGPDGEYDWIVIHPDFELSEHMVSFRQACVT